MYGLFLFVSAAFVMFALVVMFVSLELELDCDLSVAPSVLNIKDPIYPLAEKVSSGFRLTIVVA
jgi:hypothetical protein